MNCYDAYSPKFNFSLRPKIAFLQEYKIKQRPLIEAGASERGGTQSVQGCPLVLHIKYCGGEYEQLYLYFVTLKTREFQND